MRVLHTYKIFKPEVEAGIPAVIDCLTRDAPNAIQNSILVARARGLPRKYELFGVPVSASGSLGTVFSMPIAPGYAISLGQRLSKIDLLVHHAPFPLTDVALAMLGVRVPLVVHWHAEILGRRLLTAILAPAIRHTLARASRIIVSDPVMIENSDFLQQHQEKCSVIPYGADVDYWANLTAIEQISVTRIRRDFPRLILSIGRLVPYKGFSELLRAMQGLEAQLVVIGEGPLLQHLQQEALNLRVDSKVTFVGRLSQAEIKAYLHAARVFALPSNSAAEAFGIVQIEAMASGKAIVNTNLPTAVPRVARDGREALTVAVSDVLELRQALDRLLRDEALAARLGQAGRERAFREYSEKLFRQRNFELYNDVVGRNR